MKFSIRDSIGKKISVIIAAAVGSAVLILVLGLVASFVGNVCLVMGKAERDHTVNYYMSVDYFEMYARAGKREHYEKFRHHMQISSNMTRLFSTSLQNLAENPFGEVTDQFEEHFPSADHVQCRDMLFTLLLLQRHPMVKSLIQNTVNGHAFAEEILAAAEKYRETTDADEKLSLLETIYQINERMTREGQMFSNGVDALCAWAMSLVARVLVGFFLSLALVVALTALKISRSITIPFKAAVDFAGVVANGDFSRRLTVGAIDETAQLASAMNEICDEMGENIDQITTSSNLLSQGAERQTTSTRRITIILEEVSTMVEQNARNADQANTLMKEADRVVDHASESMGELTGSMDELSVVSNEIQKIIKTIDEIAFQTNLLSLNAAVEAARAGEAGAGFAVVADEVRNLAMRSADAAKNTADLIEGAVRKIARGSEMAGSAAEAFGQLAERSGDAGELVSRIAGASQEQAGGIHRVNEAVTGINEVVERISENTRLLAHGVSKFRTAQTDSAASRRYGAAPLKSNDSLPGIKNSPRAVSH